MPFLILMNNTAPVTPFELMETLNECHSQAGILAVSEDEVERELSKKREQIRKFISAKTQSLSEDDYIEFITMLAEKCIADEDYEDGVVIADVVDQYELKMQSAIEAATDEITNHLERIKRIANKEGIEANISGLVRRLKKWDKLVQPLQLKSMASGVAHQVSDRVGYDLRDLCLWLHNEQEMTEVALSLVNTLKEIFAEIGNLSDVFTSDSNALNKILRENKDSKEIIEGIKAVERIIAKWKGPDESTNPYMLATNAITDNVVNDLIAKVKTLNARIKAINADEETITQLRTALCITAREGAIYAHNEKHKTALALSIAKMLLVEFGDLEELRGKLSEDVSALNRQLIALNASRSTYTPSYQPTRSNSSGSSKKGWIIAAIIFAIIIIIAIASGNDNSSNSGSNYPNSNNNYQSNNNSNDSAKTYTITLNKQNGTGGTSSVKATYGEKLPYATAPTRTGYEFQGYFSQTNGLGTKYYDSKMNAVTYWYGSSSETLYAYWIKKSINNTSNGISVTKENFEDYFTLTTDAEFVGDTVTITYTIKPKSSTYAKNSNSSSTISVQLGGIVSPLSVFYGEPSWDEKHMVTLNKSQNYTASGSFSFTYYAFTDTVYWLADVTYCSGTIGK